MSTPVTIEAERPDTPDATALIAELSAYLQPLSPPESQHGMSVEQLLARDVAFFVLRAGGVPAGCAGLDLGYPGYAEVKRMYVRPAHRGQGFARLLLARLAAHARAAGLAVLRLETGIRQIDAIGLYERAGFRRTGPFGDYREDPESLYFELRLP